MKSWLVALAVLYLGLFAIGAMVGVWLDMRESFDWCQGTIRGLADWSSLP